MKLIGSFASPYVKKVRFVLAEKGIAHEFVVEDVWSPDPGIGVFNPLGKVPCLVSDVAESIYDSPVIVEYLDAIGSGSQLIPDGSRERATVWTWEALSDGVLDACLVARMERTWSVRPAEQRNLAWIARKLDRKSLACDAMEAAMGAGRYCYGDTFGLADLGVGCALGHLDFRFAELGWRAGWPRLAGLQERLTHRPSFLATTPK